MLEPELGKRDRLRQIYLEFDECTRCICKSECIVTGMSLLKPGLN